MLPAWAREDPDLKAVMHCYAQESDRVMDRARTVRDALIPARTNPTGFPLWERVYGLPADLPDDERAVEIRSAQQRSVPNAAGSAWEAQVARVLGPGWSYEEDSAAFTITITTLIAPGDPLLLRVQRMIRLFTPAHLDIVIIAGGAGGGFQLDASQLDVETLDQ